MNWTEAWGYSPFEKDNNVILEAISELSGIPAEHLQLKRTGGAVLVRPWREEDNEENHTTTKPH